jgi:hypothetical protein
MEGQIMKHIVSKLFVAVALVALGSTTIHAGPTRQAVILTGLSLSTSASDAALSPSQGESTELRVVRAEQWWRIQMYELDHGRWRYVGSFENPYRHRCIRYGEAWNEGKPGYRTYSGPFGFSR